LEKNNKSKATIKSFKKNFWVVILMEFFERGSYYGVMSVFSVFLVMDVAAGGRGFSKESVGLMKSITTPLLYFLPILGGAIADRFGYKKVLFFAFITMSIGYLLMGLSNTYNLIFASFIVTVLGAGVFKPIISGTIARTTDESNSSLGFGIYYWAINLGAFLVPLILIPILKNISYSYIFLWQQSARGGFSF
jgi:dipeptide/tripeptide permease